MLSISSLVVVLGESVDDAVVDGAVAVLIVAFFVGFDVARSVVVVGGTFGFSANGAGFLVGNLVVSSAPKIANELFLNRK